MVDILANAKTHFRDILAQPLKGPIEVPEWGAKIYFKAATNFQTESQVIELTQQGKTVEALVTGFILKALDEDGKPLFKKSDKVELMREVDPNIILRIINTMNEAKNEELATAAIKN